MLEAGCGVGLPGALALQLGCAELVLQDYNAAVLCWMTMRMPHRAPTPDEQPRARASRPGSNLTSRSATHACGPCLGQPRSA